MVQVFVPEMENESQEVYIVEWFKEVGDSVKEGDPLLEVMTDKANIEIPAPVSGVVRERNFEIDDRVNPGAVLAVIDPA
jgi:2-oxoglutarate dehydrogenase E2 component (dihydrolipoamide succinyltransferase)